MAEQNRNMKREHARFWMCWIEKCHIRLDDLGIRETLSLITATRRQWLAAPLRGKQAVVQIRVSAGEIRAFPNRSSCTATKYFDEQGKNGVFRHLLKTAKGKSES